MDIYEKWRMEWQRQLDDCRARPGMVIGTQRNAPEALVHEVIRLTRVDDLFESVGQITLDVSPHQYVIRCDTGPLSAEIEKRFKPNADSFEICRDFMDANRKIRSEYDSKPDRNLIRPTSWLQAFGGYYGPRLYESAMSSPLSKRLILAYKASEGYWCQGYSDGWPDGGPFVLKESSPVGLLVAAELYPAWCPGLPFNRESQSFTTMARRGLINFSWSDTDTLISLGLPTEEAIRGWL
jgi:hypothetical protein